MLTEFVILVFVVGFVLGGLAGYIIAALAPPERP